MKKQLSFLFFALGVFLLLSCTENELPLGSSQGKEKSVSWISQDSAIAISNQAIAAISNQQKTRSSDDSRQVSSIEKVSLPSQMNTRAAGNKNAEASLYLVNYKDNKGFAVVARDKRLRPLYAVSDTGNILPILEKIVKNKK